MADGRLNILLAFRSQLKGINDSLAGVRRLAGGLTALASTYVGVRSAMNGVGVMADFESSMNKVRALTGAASGEMLLLGRQAKELGATTQYTASQAADAMGFLSMAGFNVSQIMTAMPSTLQLAASAQMDLGTAADITSNILTGYRFNAEDLASANDRLVRGFTRSNTDLRQLGDAMKYAAPVASSLGVEFEETVAALGMMGKAAIQGEMAGTSLRGALVRLAKPTAEAERVMQKLGLQVWDSGGKLRSLVDIVRQLEEAGADTAELYTLFGQRAGPGFQVLISQGSEAMADFADMLRNSHGTAAGIAKIQMEGLKGAWLEAKSAVEGLAIAIGEAGLLNILTAGTKRFATFTRSITGAASAFTELVLSANRLGQLSELIALSIEAGFELGLAGGRRVWDAMWQGSGPFLHSATIGIATFGTKAFSALLEGAGALIASISAGFRLVFDSVTRMGNAWLYDFSSSFTALINKLIGGIESVTNLIRESVGSDPVHFTRHESLAPEPKAARSYAELYAEQSAYISEGVAGVTDWLNSNLAETRRLLADNTDEWKGQKSAVDTLLEKIGEIRKAHQLAAIAAEEQLLITSELAGHFDEIDKASKSMSFGGAGAVAPIVDDTDPPPSTVEPNPNFAQRAQTRFTQYTGVNQDGTDFKGDRGDAGVGMWDGAKAGLQDYVSQVGTAGQQIYNTIGGITNALSTGVTSTIMGIIEGTATWRDMLRNIGVSVVGALIQAFVDMAAQWMAKQLLMFMFGQKLKAADSATTAAKGATDAAAMAPAATMSSIASFGAAAAIGLGAVLVAMAAFGGFADGGYTGPGGKYKPAGIVHAGEYVIPKDIVDSIGVPAFDHIRATGQLPVGSTSVSTAGLPRQYIAQPGAGISRGYVAGGHVGGSSASSSASSPVERGLKLVLVDSRRSAARELARDPEHNAHVLALGSRNAAMFLPGA